MRLSRGLLISILVTLVLTLILQFFFGARAFGLFLFLPLTFLFRRQARARVEKNDSNQVG